MAVQYEGCLLGELGVAALVQQDVQDADEGLASRRGHRRAGPTADVSTKNFHTN